MLTNWLKATIGTINYIQILADACFYAMVGEPMVHTKVTV
jgi:hypothetical protein